MLEPARPTSAIRRALVAAATAILACACAWAQAQSPAPGRVALLIGNNAYPSSPLRNAVNDARDLGAVLRELGFRTIVKENTSRAEMIGALQEFGKALDGAEAALFFYAGHAMQFKDRNYLIPVDAVMGSEDDVTFFSVEVAQVFDRMERARTRFNFVILDACRDNPFRDTFKVSATGLAQMSGPSGTLIAYATAPGATAADGFGRNGVYTGQILQNIKVPDMPVEVLFRKVREGVERDTKRLQTPWELSSIKGDFVFNSTAHGASSSPSQGSGGPSADVTAQLEREFWISVRDSNRADDMQAYLDKYPNGTFTALARNRLDTLVGRTRIASTSPSGAQQSAPIPSPAAVVPEPSAAASRPPAEAAAALPTKSSGPQSSGAKIAPQGPAAAAPASREPARAAASRLGETPPKPEAVTSGDAAVATQAPAAPPASAASAPAPDQSTPAPPAPKPRDEQPGREIAPGIRELTFADGSVYRGAMRGVQLHGQGEYVSKAFKYQGDFKDGLKHGNGAYVWENGDRYQGEFAEDRPQGHGKYQFANGDSYEGEVKAGVVSGKGIYLTKSGDRIEGSFAEGRPNGVGIYRFASGDRYEGEMVAGKIEGKGRFYARNGDRIEAQFVDGRPQGKGVYYFSNGDRYEGELRQGAITGSGAYFYASGSKHEGEFVGGHPQGKGTYWFPDGSRFEGVFENGLAKATGAMIRADGRRTDAEIVEGSVRLLN